MSRDRIPAGFTQFARVLDWALCYAGTNARPLFVRGDNARTVFEVVRLTDAKRLYVEVSELWRIARRDVKGPWREDPTYRALDYARDAIRNDLMFRRQWDPELADV